MTIKIINTDYNNWLELGKLGNETVYGYWTLFEYELKRGHAFLIPYGRDSSNIKNNKTISVETTQERISNFSKLTNDSNSKHFLKELEDQSNYLVYGQINFVNIGEDGEIDLLDILVHDVTFTLDRTDINTEINLDVGDRVSFNIIGLRLWDEGIL